ncbi:MAG: FAD-dependent oxidoreductase [Lachnospiraceae bacterium]|nr:FAD-dependent oxidoreductase [Lachnospiraceae bacterium]
MSWQKSDKLIIGAGLYGLYAALYCGRRGQRVTVLEIEDAPFTRATYINQARVHMGYHYPRSLSTAMKSAGYFKRFVEDYGFCIHDSFQQIYATSSHFSWTDAREFRKFCENAGIPCMDLPAERYFRPGVCDGAFLTQEYTYDAHILRDFLLEKIGTLSNVTLCFGRRIQRIVRQDDCYEVYAVNGDGVGEQYSAPFVLNATYASVNQVLRSVEGVETQDFGLKYELCEIILCRVEEALKGIGLTVMDGPFFSIMPFGKTGYHSLTSVTFTPHKTSYDATPRFSCVEACEKESAWADGKIGAQVDGTGGKAGAQAGGSVGTHEGSLAGCSRMWLGNCNSCPHRPESAWEYMSALARKYMREEYGFVYEKSLFSMKPILKASEIDDSRPTLIRRLEPEVMANGAGKRGTPVFISVLSGKINTVYDLDEFLE